MQNDLIKFMKSAKREMQGEYERIRTRAKEDPGTAGDQGEENWAELFRNWLPPIFQIVTKGRLLGADGIASPQVDVLVLRPEYPKHLVDKKLYLADGVLAAFECKLTLTADHIEKFMENSVKISNCFPKRSGTFYKELNTPLVYGLLAHSHSWKRKKSNPCLIIKNKLIESDLKHIKHPRQIPSFACVADLAYWNSLKYIMSDSVMESLLSQNPTTKDHISYLSSSYLEFNGSGEVADSFTPIGAMLSKLLNKIAWEHPGLRSLANYFNQVELSGTGAGHPRKWDISSLLSDQVKQRIINGPFSDAFSWDEWSPAYI